MRYANGDEVKIGDRVKMVCSPDWTFGGLPGQDTVVGFHSSTCVELDLGAAFVVGSKRIKGEDVPVWQHTKTYLACLLEKV